MDEVLDECFGDLGTSFESVVDSLSTGTQGVIRSIGETKADAYKGVITTGAEAVAVIIAGIVAGIVLIKVIK